MSEEFMSAAVGLETIRQRADRSNRATHQSHHKTGLYIMRYQSALGDRKLEGVAALRIKNSEILGIDSAGVRYEGTYTEGYKGQIVGSIIMIVPADTLLVNGERKDHPTQTAFAIELQADFADGRPYTLMLQSHAVQATFERLPTSSAFLN